MNENCNSHCTSLRLFLLALLLVLPIAIFNVAPANARFLSPDTYDPWLQGVDINRYANGNNDPINSSDPNGHVAVADDVVVGAIVALGATAVVGYHYYKLETDPNYKETLESTIDQARQATTNALYDAAHQFGSIFNNDDSSEQADTEKSNPVDSANKPSRRPSAETKRKADEKAKGKDGNLECKYCGETMTTESGNKTSREFDHRTPYSKGGPSDDTNIDSICRGCNRSKSDKTLGDWLKGLFGIDK